MLNVTLTMLRVLLASYTYIYDFLPEMMISDLKKEV